MTTAVQQDIGRVLAVVLDRAHARFFEVTATGVTELPNFQSPGMRGGTFHSDRQGGPGWGEHAYHGRIREEERRHLDGVVEHLLRLDREHPADGLLVAGPGAPITAALTKALPPTLADRLIGTAGMNLLEVTPAVVGRAARAAHAAWRPLAERELLAAFEKGLGTGRATNGARETLRALARGQVRTLFVAAGIHATGFRCSQSRRMVLSATDCLDEGEPTPVPDLIGEMISEAGQQRATVVAIRDPEAARRIDGVAALLRFS
jgi:peptide subunit release factor 1 (eRF1)